MPFAAFGLLLISARGVRQLVGVRVNFDNVAPRILAVDHAVRFLPRVIISDGHALWHIVRIHSTYARNIKDAAAAPPGPSSSRVLRSGPNPAAAV
jgi:hypothetical protein